MVESLRFFERYGEPDKPVEVTAPEILCAISEGRSVHIEHATIIGKLTVDAIRSKLDWKDGGRSVPRDTIDKTTDIGLMSTSDWIRKSVIEGSLIIRFSEIHEFVNFTNVIFDGGFAEFTNVTFKQGADFRYSVFGLSCFSHSVFENAYFVFTEFRSGTSFKSTIFNGGAFFRGVNFGKSSTFESADLNDRADFRSITFYGYESDYSDYSIDFANATFGADLDFGDADLSYARFLGSSFTTIPDIGETFSEPKPLGDIARECSRSSLLGVGFLFERAGEKYLSIGRHAEAADSFRNSRVEYEKEGLYDEVGRVYVKEKKCMSLHIKAQQKNLIRLAWFWIWKHSSNYGESSWRFFGWLAGIVLVFAILYMPIISNWISWWPSIEFEEYPFHKWSDGVIDGVIHNIVAAVYFSAVTFATLGFGDIAPTNTIGRLCAIGEVLLGYLMFGVLITLVARKMTRS